MHRCMVGVGDEQHGVSLIAICRLSCTRLGKVFAVMRNWLCLLQVGNFFGLSHKGGQWINFSDVIALYRGTASVRATSLCVI